MTVKEVSPQAVYQAWSEEDRLTSLTLLLADAVSPSVDTIKTWYASEIETVLAAFLEINNSFFGIARLIKMDGLMTELISSLSRGLPDAFADSFRQAMSKPGTTDGSSS